MKKVICEVLLIFLSIPAHSGHFENGTQKRFDKARNRFSAFSEYQPQHAAMIDYQLLTDLKRFDIAQAILKSTKRLWIRIPHGYKKTDEFKVLKKQLKNLKGKTLYYEKSEEEVKTGPYNNIWARDWGPVWTRSKFVSQFPTIYDFNYYPLRQLDDKVPQDLSKLMHIPRVSAPIYFQGGNFQTTDDGVCFTNSGLVADNSAANTKDDLVFNEGQLREMLKEHLGCKKVVIFPYPSDYEGYFHIDMWMMLISNRKVALTTMDDETLNLAHDLGYSKLLAPIKEYLESRRQDLLNLGFEIVELPWPIAKMRDTYPWDPNTKVEPYLVANTYVNFQLLNKHALVPSYSFDFLPDGKSWKDRYEKQISKTLKSHGIATIFIDSDELAEWEGTIHCVISNVPSYAPYP